MMTAVANVGVIGLGNIGGAIAQNLVADGHSVTVFDLDDVRVKAIEGATPAASVGELAKAVDVTLTSLPDPDAVTAVAAEWAAHAPKGAVLVRSVDHAAGEQPSDRGASWPRLVTTSSRPR